MGVMDAGCGHGAPIWSINKRLYVQGCETLTRQNLRCGNSKFFGPMLPLRYHIKSLANFSLLPTRLLISGNVRRSESNNIALMKPEHELSCLRRPQKTANLNFVSDLGEGLKRALVELFRALHKPALVALCFGLLLMYNPEAALAASGGRMGGRAFSSSRNSSAGFSCSYSDTSSGFTFSAPYAAPSPFLGGGFGGLYMAPAFGFGVGGGGLVLYLMVGFIAVQLVSGFLMDRSDGTLLSGAQKTSMLKLQVGLLGLARSFQKDLDRLASRADTSTPEGLHFLLAETVLALLRHPDYCMSAASLSEVKKSVAAVEERFNQLSLEERGKV